MKELQEQIKWIIENHSIGNASIMISEGIIKPLTEKAFEDGSNYSPFRADLSKEQTFEQWQKENLK